MSGLRIVSYLFSSKKKLKSERYTQKLQTYNLVTFFMTIDQRQIVTKFVPNNREVNLRPKAIKDGDLNNYTFNSQIHSIQVLQCLPYSI